MTTASTPPDPAFAHDPDRNPAWTVNMAYRVYACKACDHQQTMQTNHTGTVPAARCYGRCRTITNPHTAREVVSPAYTAHRYVCEAYA
jgi:hypothetical protein